MQEQKVWMNCRVQVENDRKIEKISTNSMLPDPAIVTELRSQEESCKSFTWGAI